MVFVACAEARSRERAYRVVEVYDADERFERIWLECAECVREPERFGVLLLLRSGLWARASADANGTVRKGAK